MSGAVVHTLPAGARFDLERAALVGYAEPVPPAELAEIAATEAGMRRLARRIAREDASTGPTQDAADAADDDRHQTDRVSRPTARAPRRSHR